MNLSLGTLHTMLVDGETETGYIVTKGLNETILSFEETNQAYRVGELVDVFVYQAKDGDVTVTAKLPDIVIGSYGWVEVVDIFPSLGVFVKLTDSIDVLLPKDDLPFVHKAWPLPKDKLYMTLSLDKQNRLLGKLAKETIFEDMMQIASSDLELNERVAGRIIRSEREGAVIFTDDHYRGFIHHSEMEDDVRLGELVEGRIIEVKENGTINVSLKPMKHERLDDDAETILSYIEAQDGQIPFGDKSDPDLIRDTFGMSKSAFKRALGRLMREGKVKQENGSTFKI